MAGLVAWTAELPFTADFSLLAGLTVGAGFILYLIDFPELAPEYYQLGAKKWIDGRADHVGMKPQHRYLVNRLDFIFLDDLLPAGVRTRSEYYRVMFRVGLEFSLLLLLGLSLAAILGDAGAQPSLTGNPDWTSVLLIAAFAGGGAISVAATSYVAGRRKKAKASSMVATALQKHRWRIAMAVFLSLAVVLAQRLLSDVPRFLVVAIGCLTATSLWWVAVLRGQLREPETPRRFIPTSEKTVILIAAASPPLIALANVSAQAGRHAPLAAWCALVLVALLTEGRRKYVDRYEGASREQQTWMQMCQSVIDSALVDGQLTTSHVLDIRRRLAILQSSETGPSEVRSDGQDT